MPSRNQLKNYVPKAFYHLYNRGVGKMDIFRKEQDFATFLYYLKTVLSSPDILREELSVIQNGESFWQDPVASSKIKRLTRAIQQSYKFHLDQELELLFYVLMPNHFHLLVHQKRDRSIEILTKRVMGGYAGYFTREYQHLGTLVQGRYNAAHLYYEPELQVLFTARYFARNALQINHSGNVSRRMPPFKGMEEYPFSSLKYYLAEERSSGQAPFWLNTRRLREIFDKIKSSPNSYIEEMVARHENLTDFLMSGIDFNLEDLRLAHLESL